MDTENRDFSAKTGDIVPAADGCKLNFFARVGHFSVKVGAALLLGLVKGVKLILSELLELAVSLLKVLLWILRELTSPLRNRFNINKDMQKKVMKAKKAGKSEYNKALFQFWFSYLFGEDGVFYTAFNYILPVVSIAFLIGIIRYGSGLEYGLSVEYNGREIGIITAEADFEAAEREVQQRIAYADSDETIDLSAKYSLRIINENDKVVSSSQLANEMLAASDEALTEAFGIYIDGKFIGAVTDKEPVQDALNERILNYRVDGVVKDISYKNNIEYSHGIYLASSVMDTKAAIDLLTSSKEKKAVYVAQKGDTAVTIAMKYNMDLNKLEELNEGIIKKCSKGMIVNVIETESYLPIQYVREMDPVTFLDYETVEVETSSLNVGVRDTLVVGRRGEKTSHVEITYVDGKEYSRKTISSKITKEPVVEKIGIGIYAARPDSPDTVLTGSGEFGWPVDGGWVSDGFGGERNHKGMDIAASTGTEIYAAADGEVVSAGWNTGGYGYFVQIGHTDEYQTVYGHMSEVLVDEGQYVSRGQLIGLVGNTGNSFGSHCHFEVRHLGICLDPALFLNTTESFNTEADKKKEDDKKKDKN
ncbi:M23 family metallopeptidase [Ruminococcus flavefaciens]|uniref:Murein DD-endopeptidase MepM/ murein hydrolase activator NlpD n=1 Tax=Ruminococcus flavefaciens TaxID=1265 RepID=A0A315YNB9_RUMFL|nr:M23 family metallopeptidase [Ruminococcus flavefaciens]PWJ13392.1 murein DD-endopeptidase MepM/ murein hydrolase activator NlpD [Ruminococcus flavefaciens]SSA47895.1 Murein DD-endopeptidase MepM and murein hydrolase activator NlpD, contain LysM domain [Ruminococcus flavefaciens]